MKKYLYEGKIITADSKKEAIAKVICSGYIGAIKNRQLRRLLDTHGYKDIVLVQDNGYLWVDCDGTNKKHQDALYALDSTSIYRNSFSQATPQTWFNEIDEMIKEGEKIANNKGISNSDNTKTVIIRK